MFECSGSMNCSNCKTGPKFQETKEKRFLYRYSKYKVLGSEKPTLKNERMPPIYSFSLWASYTLWAPFRIKKT